jgi:hypothetical protein
MWPALGDAIAICCAAMASTVYAHNLRLCIALKLESAHCVSRTNQRPDYHVLRCLQCTKKACLTRVVFNPKHPILLIGDSKGNISAHKLSPNLRRCSKPEKPGTKVEELERQKLDKVVEVARKSQAPALAAAAAEAVAEAAALAALAASGASE